MSDESNPANALPACPEAVRDEEPIGEGEHKPLH